MNLKAQNQLLLSKSDNNAFCLILYYSVLNCLHEMLLESPNVTMLYFSQ